MCEVVDISDGESSPRPKIDTGIKPKVEFLDYSLPPGSSSSGHLADNAASSSGTNLRSSFIAMGFAPFMVDRAIKENGEENVDLLLETLFAYSALQNPKIETSDDGLFSDKRDGVASDIHVREVLHQSESSDSLDSLFGDDNTSTDINSGRELQLKEEPAVGCEDGNDKRATLLKMSFSLDEVEFATGRLGQNASIDDLVDFIIAARMAKKYDKDANYPAAVDEEKNKESSNEALFGIMEKTLRLLEMGFSEQEISDTFEKHGLEVPLAELADIIVADQNASGSSEVQKYSSMPLCTSAARVNRSLNMGMGDCLSSKSSALLDVKTEDLNPDASPQVRNFDLLEKLKGKRPKAELTDEPSGLKKPKTEYDSDSVGLRWLEARIGRSSASSRQLSTFPRQVSRKQQEGGFGLANMSMPNSSKSIDQMVAQPPYFFYGNVTNLSVESWIKVSQFLYSIEPEFVETQLFSALRRKEGYVHNLPSNNRFHILPKPPMTIEEAIPHTKKWWPSWDTRKQFTCISSETSGTPQLCDRLARMLTDSRGLVSAEQQRDLLNQCETFNLVWVGHHKLAQVEPEHLEQILGYPLHHTRIAGFSSAERLMALKHSFQTDALGHHLSTLKSLVPEGLRVLSIYSGIGGAEVTLHRLGIHLKGVVSVEPCETKRRILKRWWDSSVMGGELVQIDSIRRLASSKLEGLINKFGGFDFIICQNPYANSPGKDTDSLAGLDFSLFVEFVRVLQRVRVSMERNR